MSSQPLDVVVLGAASRDVTTDDPRGWRLGGAVTYASLTMAHLGLRVAALIGADPDAAVASELDLLRAAEVEVFVVPLLHGPVFENIEGPTGRVQRIRTVSDLLPPFAADVLGDRGRAARGWFVGPVAGEVADEWAGSIPARPMVALGWQGLLRSFLADGTVRHELPRSSDLLSRANLVGVGRDDLASDAALRELGDLLAPDATLVITHGADGGFVLGPVSEAGEPRRPLRRYPAIPSRRVVDVTGAGDVFLSALFAARLEPRLIGDRGGRGFDLLLAAAAASLVVEAEGLHGVPTPSAVRDRMREGLAQANASRPRG